MLFTRFAFIADIGVFVGSTTGIAKVVVGIHTTGLLLFTSGEAKRYLFYHFHMQNSQVRGPYIIN
jgi:hypothetical protein